MRYGYGASGDEDSAMKPIDLTVGLDMARRIRNVSAEVAMAIPKMKPGDRLEVVRYADDHPTPVVLTVTQGSR